MIALLQLYRFATDFNITRNNTLNELDAMKAGTAALRRDIERTRQKIDVTNVSTRKSMQAVLEERMKEVQAASVLVNEQSKQFFLAEQSLHAARDRRVDSVFTGLDLPVSLPDHLRDIAEKLAFQDHGDIHTRLNTIEAELRDVNIKIAGRSAGQNRMTDHKNLAQTADAAEPKREKANVSNTADSYYKKQNNGSVASDHELSGTANSQEAELKGEGNVLIPEDSRQEASRTISVGNMATSIELAGNVTDEQDNTVVSGVTSDDSMNVPTQEQENSGEKITDEVHSIPPMADEHEHREEGRLENEEAALSRPEDTSDVASAFFKSRLELSKENVTSLLPEAEDQCDVAGDKDATEVIDESTDHRRNSEVGEVKSSSPMPESIELPSPSPSEEFEQDLDEPTKKSAYQINDQEVDKPRTGSPKLKYVHEPGPLRVEEGRLETIDGSDESAYAEGKAEGDGAEIMPPKQQDNLQQLLPEGEVERTSTKPTEQSKENMADHRRSGANGTSGPSTTKASSDGAAPSSQGPSDVQFQDEIDKMLNIGTLHLQRENSPEAILAYDQACYLMTMFLERLDDDKELKATYHKLLNKYSRRVEWLRNDFPRNQEQTALRQPMAPPPPGAPSNTAVTPSRLRTQSLQPDTSRHQSPSSAQSASSQTPQSAQSTSSLRQGVEMFATWVANAEDIINSAMNPAQRPGPSQSRHASTAQVPISSTTQTQELIASPVCTARHYPNVRCIQCDFRATQRRARR